MEPRDSGDSGSDAGGAERSAWQQQQQQPRQQQGGASSVEVYGFVGWITSSVAFALYVLWAALPEEQLHRLGITYYPSKHWALAIPLWLLLAVAYIYWAYEGLNAMTVPPLSSLTNIQDPKSKWARDLGLPSAFGAAGRSIPPLMHVPPPVACRVLYGGEGVREAEAAEAALAGAAEPAPRAGGAGAGAGAPVEVAASGAAAGGPPSQRQAGRGPRRRGRGAA